MGRYRYLCVLLIVLAVLHSQASAAGVPDTFAFTVDIKDRHVVDSGQKNTAEISEQVDLDVYADRILSLINQAREQAGLHPVERCDAMDGVAAVRAAELAESFSHTRPDGSSYADLADQAGVLFTWIGENGARVPISSGPEKMVAGWMRSEGHRKNMLYDGHQAAGIGVHQVGQRLYCSLLLYC